LPATVSSTGDGDSPEISWQIALAREPFLGISDPPNRLDLLPTGIAFVVPVIFAAKRASRGNNRAATGG
jgi:hypothetical protein